MTTWLDPLAAEDKVLLARLFDTNLDYAYAYVALKLSQDQTRRLLDTFAACVEACRAGIELGALRVTDWSLEGLVLAIDDAKEDALPEELFGPLEDLDSRSPSPAVPVRAEFLRRLIASGYLRLVKHDYLVLELSRAQPSAAVETYCIVISDSDEVCNTHAEFNFVEGLMDEPPFDLEWLNAQDDEDFPVD